MRTRLLPFAATAGIAALLVLAACSGPSGAGSTSASATTSASASASSSAATATAFQVKVIHTTAGDALVGAGGKTLYWNTTETKGIVCTGKCAAIWPPFTLSAGAKTSAGSGVTAGWLATVMRPDGTTQVTYAGHPLYYFASDTATSDANGQGISGIWFIATANGKLPSPSASAKATASPSSGYGY
jgi:predicted lipoprotein with Yx(FWY)xxD motif